MSKSLLAPINVMLRTPRSAGRIRVISAFGCAIALLLFSTSGCTKQTEPPAAQADEARRLYERADLFVKKIDEGQYTYDYINFHYNQALKNVDRILLAYPETELGQKLRRGELKLGKFTLDHFRDTVLVQLGDMKEATESIVNCAIYLHTLPEASRPESKEALGLILETLCRLVRSDEALIFPTLPEDRIFAQRTIIRTISRYLQGGISLSLVQGADEDSQPILAGAYLEGLAVGGLQLENIEDLIERYKSAGRDVELGALRGMIERETQIYRDQFDKVKKERERAALEAAKSAGTLPDQPKEDSVRYDIGAFYATHFGARALPAASQAFASFRALQGHLEEALRMAGPLNESAKVDVIGAHFEHLALTGKLSGGETLHREHRLNPDSIARAQMKLIELLAQNAKYEAADALQLAGTTESPKFRDHFIRARWRGRFYSREELFYLDAKTIPNLGIKDPAICAQVLLDWFLSPNRLLRGSSWGADAIVYKYFSMQKEGRPPSRQLLNKNKKTGS